MEGKTPEFSKRTNAHYVKLVTSCWNFNPANRPDTGVICKELKEIIAEHHQQVRENAKSTPASPVTHKKTKHSDDHHKSKSSKSKRETSKHTSLPSAKTKDKKSRDKKKKSSKKSSPNTIEGIPRLPIPSDVPSSEDATSTSTSTASGTSKEKTEGDKCKFFQLTL